MSWLSASIFDEFAVYDCRVKPVNTGNKPLLKIARPPQIALYYFATLDKKIELNRIDGLMSVAKTNIYKGDCLYVLQDLPKK